MNTKDVKLRIEDKVFYSPDGCWIWIGKVTGRPNELRPKITYHKKLVNACRLYFEIVRGVKIGKLFLCHTCDNTLCVNPDHVFIGTTHDNMIDMVRKNRSNKKLSIEQVIEIRALYKTLGSAALAKKYNVHPATISGIVNRQHRKHISI